MKNSSDLDSLKCPVCFAFLDADQHVPYVFSSCGHTICKECILIANIYGIYCPFDGNFQPGNYENCFATNFLAKDLLEIKGKWARCSDHEEERLKMVCLTDNTLVCHYCVIFGEHKGHEVKLLSDYEKQVNSRKNELEVLYQKLSKSFDEMMTSLLQKRETIENLIIQRYQSFYTILREQEHELLSKVNTIFGYEIDYLKSHLNESLLDIDQKLRELDSIMSNPEISKILQTGFTNNLDETLENLDIIHEQELPEILKILQNSLPKEDLFEDLEKMMEPLNQKLIQFNKAKILPLENNNDDRETITFEAEIDISFNSEGTVITIFPLSNYKSRYELDLTKLSRVKSIEYYLTQDIYSAEILKVFSLLSKNLVNAESIFIEAQNSREFHGIHEIIFLNYLTVVLSRPQNLKHICLVCKELSIGELGLMFFCEELLPNIPDLKSLSLDFRRTITHPRVLKAISNIDCSSWPNLKEFNVILIDSIFHEEYLKKFLGNIPNVREVFINLANIPLTDKIIEDFSVNVLPKLDKAKTLKIEFWKTELTDVAVQKFLVNIPNGVKKLVVGLAHLKITDSSLQDFLDRKFRLLTNLKELNLMVSNTNLSREMCYQISQLSESVNLKLFS